MKTNDATCWRVVQLYRSRVVNLTVALAELAEVVDDENSLVFVSEFEEGEKMLAAEFLRAMLKSDGLRPDAIWTHTRLHGPSQLTQRLACVPGDRGFFPWQGCHAAQVLDSALVEAFQDAERIMQRRADGWPSSYGVRRYCDAVHEMYLALPPDGERGSARSAVLSAKVELAQINEGELLW